MAVPGYNDPTYIIYPSSTPSPNIQSSSTTQNYLKPAKSKFHPAGSYDAPTQSKSIYREETSKYHSGNLVQLPKVIYK